MEVLTRFGLAPSAKAANAGVAATTTRNAISAPTTSDVASDHITAA
jgi:hypothetical protein